MMMKFSSKRDKGKIPKASREIKQGSNDIRLSIAGSETVRGGRSYKSTLKRTIIEMWEQKEDGSDTQPFENFTSHAACLRKLLKEMLHKTGHTPNKRKAWVPGNQGSTPGKRQRKLLACWGRDIQDWQLGSGLGSEQRLRRNVLQEKGLHRGKKWNWEITWCVEICPEYFSFLRGWRDEFSEWQASRKLHKT